MAILVDTLATYVDLPVVNQTSIEGYYDITLDLTAEDYRTMLIRAGINSGIAVPPRRLCACWKGRRMRPCSMHWTAWVSRWKTAKSRWM